MPESVIDYQPAPQDVRTSRPSSAPKDAEVSGRLSRRDFIIGTVIALAMATFFTVMSSGLSLIVTFVPGVIVSWLVFSAIYARGIALPSVGKFIPLFFLALAVQFLHFAEEYSNGFATLFPKLYGGSAYSLAFFVAFNMASYAVFTICALLVFFRGLRFLLLPVLFYVVYGAAGNAISHSWWVAYSQAYFPGFYTAQLYWILGPWLLYLLLGSRRMTATLVVAFAVLLIATTTAFMTG